MIAATCTAATTWLIRPAYRPRLMGQLDVDVNNTTLKVLVVCSSLTDEKKVALCKGR